MVGSTRYSSIIIATFSLSLMAHVNGFYPFDLPTFPEPPTKRDPPPPAPESERNASTTRLDSSVELVFGTFAQDVDDAWFYEAYYPILLKLPIPDWSSDAHRLNRSYPKCMGDEMSPNYLCPLQFHQDNLLLRMSQHTRFFKNIYVSMLLFPDDKPLPGPKKIYEEGVNCLKIKPHFTHFSGTMKQIKPYLDELRATCPLAKEVGLIEKKLSASEDIQTAVRKAYQKWTEGQKAGLSKLKSEGITMNTFLKGDNVSFGRTHEEWKFLQMIGYTTFQNTFALATYIDSIKWANAFSTCQANRLDIGMVPPNLLEELLKEAQRNVSKEEMGYNISIPWDNLITHYYKLPLIDCVLTIDSLTEANLILRLLVPVTRMYKYYKLVKLSKVPFYIRSTTTNEYGSICEIKNYNQDDNFLVEYDTQRGESHPVVTSIMKAPLTCGSYHVCRLPDVVHRDLVDPCVEGIIMGNEAMTKEKCDFKCYDVTSSMMEEFPWVIQLTSNRFAIVGATANETKGEVVVIKCFGKTRIAAVKQNSMDEATLVILPCPCEIVVGNRSFFSQYPCNGTLEIMHVTHVIPDGNDGGFKFFEGDTTRNIKNESTLDISSSELNAKSQSDKEEKDKKDKDKDQDVIEEEEEFIEDDILFNTPYADNSNDNEDSHGGIANDPDHMLVDAICTNHGMHVTLWILCFILLLSNLYVGYIMNRCGMLTIDSILFTRTNN